MLYVKFDPNDDTAHLVPLSQGTDEQIYEQFSALMTEYNGDFEKFGYLTRFKDNEDYMEGRHWDQVAKEDPNEPQPHTPVLWSTRENILADLIEAYPRANPEPERVADKEKVRIVADMINSVRYRRNYRAKWGQLMRGMLDQGVDILEVFWDKTLYGGLGDVNYTRWSIRNCRFDPYVADINDSEAFITLSFERKRALFGKYPDKREKINSSNQFNIRPSDLTGGTNTPTPDRETDLALVARMFWREITLKNTPVGAIPEYSLHWAKIAGGAVVERAVPRPDGTVKSLYRHGEYSFVPYTLEDKDGSLFPLGIVDRFKKTQWFVDAMDQIVLKNLFVSARQKLLVSNTANLDMDALRDWKKDIVTGEQISERDVRWFENKQFASAPMEYSQVKIDAMKDEAGANQFYRGEGGRGVTAASAIFALQDASGRRTKKLVERCYYADCKVSMLTAELQAEFYTEKRAVMVVDSQGNEKDLEVTTKDFLKDGKGGLIDMRMRMSAEKNQGYKTDSKNQRAVELMQTGVIDQSIGLAMMDFDEKEQVMQMIREREASELTQLKQLVAQWAPIVEQVQKAGGMQQPFTPPKKAQPDDESVA